MTNSNTGSPLPEDAKKLGTANGEQIKKLLDDAHRIINSPNPSLEEYEEVAQALEARYDCAKITQRLYAKIEGSQTEEPAEVTPEDPEAPEAESDKSEPATPKPAPTQPAPSSVEPVQSDSTPKHRVEESADSTGDKPKGTAGNSTEHASDDTGLNKGSDAKSNPEDAEPRKKSWLAKLVESIKNRFDTGFSDDQFAHRPKHR